MPVLFGAGIAALVSQWRQPAEETTPTPTPEETDPAATRGRASIEQLPPPTHPHRRSRRPGRRHRRPGSTATADPSTAEPPEAPAARPSPSPTRPDEVATPADPDPERPPTPARKPTPRKDPAASKPPAPTNYQLGANQAPIITD